MPPARFEVVYSGVISADSPKDAAALAKRMARLGLRQIKIKVGTPDDAARLDAVRQAVGSKVELRADANGAWSAAQAIEQLKQLAPFKLAVIEQPVAADDIAGMKQVRAQCAIPVMADESLVTIEQARRLIAEKACDLFNIRLSKNGGITGSLAIAKLARGSRNQNPSRRSGRRDRHPIGRRQNLRRPCAGAGLRRRILRHLAVVRRHHVRQRRLRPRRPRATAEKPRLERHGQGRSLRTTAPSRKSNCGVKPMSVIVKAAAFVTGRLWSSWEKLCADPATVQNRLLLDIIQRNRATAFGKDHGFAAIRSLADYRQQVAIGDYERLRPYVERAENGEAQVLTEAPVRDVHLTSGSTGAPKLIPVTETTPRQPPPTHAPLVLPRQPRSSRLVRRQNARRRQSGPRRENRRQYSLRRRLRLDLSEQPTLDSERLRPALRGRRGKRFRRQVLPDHAFGVGAANHRFSARPIRARFCAWSKSPIIINTEIIRDIRDGAISERWHISWRGAAKSRSATREKSRPRCSSSNGWRTNTAPCVPWITGHNCN